MTALDIVNIDEDERQIFITDEERGYSIPFGAVGRYSDLLGLDDPVCVVEAILHFRKRGTEPPEDPATGANVWGEAFAVLTHREEAREAEARRAIREGKANDPRSPRLRGAMAARLAVMDPVGAETEAESLLEQVRTAARTRLDIPCSGRAPIAGRAGKSWTRRDPDETELGREFTREDRQRLREALEPYLDAITARREQMLHGLTGEADDPLAEPEPAPAKTSDPSTLDGILARHGGTTT